MFRVPEQMQLLLDRCSARTRIGLRGKRIDISLAVDANRRHLPDRRIERTRLTTCRIPGVIDTLSAGRQAKDDQQNSRSSKANDGLKSHAAYVITRRSDSQPFL